MQLSAQTASDVQFRLPGSFEEPFAFLNEIPEDGLDLNSDGTIDVVPACTCRGAEIIENGTNSDNGYFDDQLIIATGISNQIWTLGDHQNVLSAIDLSSIPIGTVVPEVGNTGIYVLRFVHSEATSFNAFVENLVDYPQALFPPVENQCFYPDPEVINLDTFYCDDAENISLLGATTSPFDGNVEWLPPSNESWFVTREEDGMFLFSSVFSPGTLGEGTYNVQYIYDGGNPMNQINRTGCKRIAEIQVVVQAAYPMVCNGNLSTSIGVSSCEVVLTPANLLVGTPDHPENFSIDVITDDGTNLGSTLTADVVGQQLTAIVTDNCNGVFCTSEIELHDFAPPTLMIPQDTVISCLSSFDPENTGFASAFDCQEVTISHEDEWIDLDCSDNLFSAKINRTWVAVDASGNETHGVQEIFLRLGDGTDLLFPRDTIMSCIDWMNDPTITDGTDNGAGVPNLSTIGICKIAASFEDDTLPYCGNAMSSFIILREWTVVNLCTNEILLLDANGDDPVQFITVLDDIPPEISTQPVVLSAEIDLLDSGNGLCVSRGWIPPPIYFDDCNDVTIRIYSAIGELDYVNGMNGNEGGFLPEPGLPIGNYTLVYEAIDACDNTQLAEGELDIIDDEPPVVICNSGLTLVLPSNGNGVLFATSIDEGSRDNCCVDAILIKKSNETALQYRPFIEFFCDNDTLEIDLRVTDCSGNFNECSTQVIVRDNQPPFVAVSPMDEFFECQDDIQPYYNADFHAPTFEDNCGFEVSFSTILDVNDCGIGRLIRVWEANDNDLNPVAVDTQSIWLQPNHDYEMILPADTIMSCPLVSFNDVVLKEFGCDLLGATVSFDTLITNENGLCMSIFRNYSIVNWCEYDGESEATELPRLVDESSGLASTYLLHSNGNILLRSLPGGELPVGISTGFYTYQQQVHIVDSQAPELETSGDRMFCLNADCLGAVNIAFSVSDDCTALPFVTYKIRNEVGVFITDTIGVLDYLGENTYQVVGSYPPGAYELEVEIRDNCGAIGRIPLTFVVKDCEPPEITCLEEIFVDLDENREYSLSLASVMDTVIDNCSEVQASFSQDNLQEFLLLDCSDTGVDTIPVWATDAEGNEAVCSVIIHVRDTVLNCFSFYDIDGRVYLEGSDGIGGVTIELQGEMNAQTITSTNGDFLLEEIIEANQYRLIAQKEDTYLNGVSTFDIIQIQRHLLGTLPLSSPYKILAADVNDSGIISTLDIIHLRKLILGITTTFPNRTSAWLFVPKDYEFINVLDPLQEDFPHELLIQPFDSSRTVDFIGIKIGDVNNSVDL